jgi:hypothetical protein
MEYCVEPSEISRRLAKRPVTIREGIEAQRLNREWGPRRPGEYPI